MAKSNGKTDVAKKEDTSELKCVSVKRIAFNHEEIVLENSVVKLTLVIKDPAEHGYFTEGESYENVIADL